MNQSAPASDSPPLPPIADFKDRRAGLMVFGILEILLGALCILMVGFMVLGQVVMSRAGGAALSARMMLPGMLTYVSLAAAFVWLGIGSIRCRRWARALVLVLAWFWLCIGVITVPLMAFLMPRILSASTPNGPGLPRGVLVTVVVFQMVFMTLFMIAAVVRHDLLWFAGHIAGAGPGWLVVLAWPKMVSTQRGRMVGASGFPGGSGGFQPDHFLTRGPYGFVSEDGLSAGAD